MAIRSKVTLTVLVVLSTFGDARSHKEWVHQHLVKEAKKLLEDEMQFRMPKFHQNFGVDRNGPFNGPGPFLFLSRDAVVLGAWHEDIDDLIWDHMDIFGSSAHSATHFWDADNGDDADIPSNANGRNAMRKGQHFFGGRDFDANYKFFNKDEVSFTLDDGSTFNCHGRMMSYQNLPELIRTGKMKVHSFFEINGREIIFDPPESYTVKNDLEFTFGYQLLGRVAHLLGDMSVPAHAHNDTHPCDLDLGDTYELEMGSADFNFWFCNDAPSEFTAQDFTAATARQRGGLMWEVFSMPDDVAIKYLMYIVNQLADRFASIEEENNHLEDAGDANQTNWTTQFVARRYAEISAPFDTYERELTAEHAFNDAIRATATLFLLAQVRAEQTACMDVLRLQADKFAGIPTPFQTAFFEASNEIRAGSAAYGTTLFIPNEPYHLLSGANAEFRAGQRVRLLPGFSAKSGSTFRAKITSQPCSHITEPAERISKHWNLAGGGNSTASILDTASTLYIYLRDSGGVVVNYSDTTIVKNWRSAKWKYPDTTNGGTEGGELTDIADTIIIRNQQDSVIYQSIGTRKVTYMVDSVIITTPPGPIANQLTVREIEAKTSWSVERTGKKFVCQVYGDQRPAKFRVFDALGRDLATSEGHSIATFDFSAYTYGVYYIVLEIGDARFTKKIMWR